MDSPPGEIICASTVQSGDHNWIEEIRHSVTYYEGIQNDCHLATSRGVFKLLMKKGFKVHSQILNAEYMLLRKKMQLLSQTNPFLLVGPLVKKWYFNLNTQRSVPGHVCKLRCQPHSTMSVLAISTNRLIHYQQKQSNKKRLIYELKCGFTCTMKTSGGGILTQRNQRSNKNWTSALNGSTNKRSIFGKPGKTMGLYKK